jgi:peptide-methionine (S)-S-oxide reductase
VEYSARKDAHDQRGGRTARPGGALAVPAAHEVPGTARAAVSRGQRDRQFALGCFWGAEKAFWNTKGVISTSVGYEVDTPEPDL